jgi:SAM-dependent methyltransferase
MSSAVIFLSDPAKLPSVTALDSWYEVAYEDHFWFQWRFAAFVEQLRSQGIDLKGKRLLEVGCGCGILRTQIEKHLGATVDGTDLNVEGLKKCAPSLRDGKVYFYDIFQKDPQFAEKYDGAVLFDILEHLSDPPKFLEALRFHLKPGGQIFINVPARPELFSVYDKVLGHERRYTPAVLVKHLDEGGFETVCKKYWGLTLYPLLFGRRIWFSLTNPSAGEAMQKGFEPKSKVLHEIFKLMGKTERAILKKSPWGMALLAVGKKRD